MFIIIEYIFCLIMCLFWANFFYGNYNDDFGFLTEIFIINVPHNFMQPKETVRKSYNAKT